VHQVAAAMLLPVRQVGLEERRRARGEHARGGRAAAGGARRPPHGRGGGGRPDGRVENMHISKLTGSSASFCCTSSVLVGASVAAIPQRVATRPAGLSPMWV
jgi:hypothetical protein